MGKVICALLRISHIILAALVLGLSINAVNWQYYGDAPATNAFAAFTGGFGALAGLIGFAAIWITPLGGYVTFVFDLLASIFFLAAGIAFAVGLHGTNCSDGSKFETWHNKLISGGCRLIFERDHDYQCGFFEDFSNVERRCRLATVDAVFLFFGCVVSGVAAFVCFTAARKNKGISSV